LFVQESLEARVLELEKALEAEQKNGQRERLALTRLQRQLARVSREQVFFFFFFSIYEVRSMNDLFWPHEQRTFARVNAC
jgi:hypothetical protein